jgi:hypothetical protein
MQEMRLLPAANPIETVLCDTGQCNVRGTQGIARELPRMQRICHWRKGFDCDEEASSLSSRTLLLHGMQEEPGRETVL